MYITTGRSGISAGGNANLKLSVRILDRDHLELSQTIKDIQADILAGKDRGRTAPLLRKLTAFTRAHFALEEGMMEATEYPGLALHSVRHQSMMQQLRAFISCYGQGGSDLGVHLPWFLAEWHTAHIRNEDLQLGRWLNGQHSSGFKEGN